MFTLYLVQLLPPATKLREGNVFTPVCHSVQGGSLSRGSLSRGVSVEGSLRGGSLSRGSVSGRPPYGNLWTVHSLLECILVHNRISSIFTREVHRVPLTTNSVTTSTWL